MSRYNDTSGRDLVITLMAMGGLLVGGWCFNRARAEALCNSFGEVTGRQVRFVAYPWFTYGCLAMAKDGKWIDRGALRETVD